VADVDAGAKSDKFMSKFVEVTDNFKQRMYFV
jgi:hypothetical protein